jgi:hypothetical protein
MAPGGGEASRSPQYDRSTSTSTLTKVREPGQITSSIAKEILVDDSACGEGKYVGIKGDWRVEHATKTRKITTERKYNFRNMKLPFE